MMKILDLLRASAGEAPLSGAVGRWKQVLSAAADDYLRKSGFLTQTDWAIDPVNGDDGNEGTRTSPLRSLSQFALRWQGRTFDPSLPVVNVSLLGSFAGQRLLLPGIFPGPTAVNVAGTMREAGRGTITNWQAFNPGGGLRAQLTDAAQDFTPHKYRRIRITTGPAAGAVTRICSLAGPAVANVGQFTNPVLFVGTAVNPQIGDSYVIETFDTDISEYHVAAVGDQVTTLSAISLRPGSGFSFNDTQGVMWVRNRLFGCEFNSTGALLIILQGPQTWVACAGLGDGTIQTVATVLASKGFCALNGLWHTMGSCVQASYTVHDGDGLVNAHLRVADQAQVADVAGFRAFFGVVDGVTDACVHVGDTSWASEGSTTVWGSGNTTTYAFRVRNGGNAGYDTKPTLLGGTPGNDVKLGPSVLAWGAIPACNAPPDNAAFNVRVQP